MLDTSDRHALRIIKDAGCLDTETAKLILDALWADGFWILRNEDLASAFECHMALEQQRKGSDAGSP
jgi:hypothetical protein